MGAGLKWPAPVRWKADQPGLLRRQQVRREMMVIAAGRQELLRFEGGAVSVQAGDRWPL